MKLKSPVPDWNVFLTKLPRALRHLVQDQGNFETLMAMDQIDLWSRGIGPAARAILHKELFALGMMLPGSRLVAVVVGKDDYPHEIAIVGEVEHETTVASARAAR